LFQETTLNELRIVVVLHLVLGPFAVWMMAEDARHPERWDTWYCNPATAIPYCLALEGVIWGVLLHKRRKERQFAEGIRLLDQANQLRAQGRYREADVVWQEGLRLTGQKP
jgi:hypothetical protein